VHELRTAVAAVTLLVSFCVNQCGYGAMYAAASLDT
jgi:hypothetical protein